MPDAPPLPLAQRRLPPEKLYHRCDAAALGFETTESLADLGHIVGQRRATEAVELGIGIAHEGYNLFVMGPPGTGKHTLVRQFLDARARAAPRPNDWVYVNNFAAPGKPLAIELPPGRGEELKRDMRQLVEELRSTIPAVFESEEYTAKVGEIDAEFSERHERALTALGEEATRESIALLRTPAGFSFAPVKDGEIVTPDEFAKLPEEEQRRIETVIGELQSKLERLIRDALRWRKERHERVRKLNHEMVLLAVGHAVAELEARYREHPRVVAYLDAVQQDVLENADDFRKREEGPAALLRPGRDESGLRRYDVNVVVSHAGDGGAPVVFADHPTFQNLVGRIDHIAQLGTLVTDFNLIKPGALHRANGGFLLIDVAKLLVQPFAYDALKRALVRGDVRIESLGEMYSLVSTVSLEPEPVPLKVKVILFGERLLYYLLCAYDPDFGKLFRIAADFEESFERNAETTRLYAGLIGTVARREGLLPLDAEAVARLVEQGSRAAGDAAKIDANVDALIALLGEADHVARQRGARVTGREDVAAAIAARRRRAARVKERLDEAILRGTLLIDTDGAKAGQVNGLSVFEAGGEAFGSPMRITATTRVGDGHVIDVQREVQLGGAIHSKGVLILASFLAARYSGAHPHSLAASLVFEQTYGEVEGDSASLAELCALLSSLADVPLRQSFAVTGSVNQLGEVQAIGGVNEKIEGFFDVCRARGLTGEQGVLIPQANVAHLMLREDVVEAVRAGRFHVIPVASVDEAIEILTGVPAGTPHHLGEYPEQTVNARVAARLREFAAAKRGPAAAGVRRGRGAKRGGRNGGE
ncbi:MAG: AAA family ATPase [Burkholderiales bacterium]|nr:AAA family ATPase [Burkholderiales bacterium]